MTTHDDSVGRTFLDSAIRQLESSTAKIDHCVAQLDDPQLWWQPTPTQNSVGNLILHLCGNVRQWIVSGVGGARDVRDRPGEFLPNPDIRKDSLLETLHRCVDDAKDSLALDISLLTDRRRIQGFDTTVLAAVFDTVSHFQGHTQEIISLTRQQLGDSYEFHWIPSTDDEISAKRD
jgi:hypothetical protein